MKKNSTLFFLMLNFICLAQKPSGVLDMNVKLEAMYYPKPVVNFNKAPSQLYPEAKESITQQKINSPILNTTFYRLTGSHDMLGNLSSSNKPLQYNELFKAFSFVCRKSLTYVPASNGNSGTIVGFVGKNDAFPHNASSWDSTCLWTSTLNIAQKAQGGIWLNGVPSNPNLATQGYFIATGTTKSGTTVTGSFRASKLVGTAGTNTPGIDIQFFSNIAPFSTTTSPQMPKQDEPDHSFNPTIGSVWIPSMIYNDVNGSNDVSQGIRGAHISKGVFTSGSMMWNSDSLIPPTVLKTNGTKQLWRQPLMTFSPDGQCGYLLFIGTLTYAPIGSPNRGMQPIIYKTTNSGASWNLVNGIDFTQTVTPYPYILNSLDPVNTNPTLKIPYFNPAEGIDITMDQNNKLHILTTVCGTAKQHIDSVNYIHQYTNNGETYCWPHVNGKRPYILDFCGDGTTGWDCKIIDSLTTECPATYSAGPGYSFNPWADPNPNMSISSGSRLQISRSFCGDYLMYSWAEADTNITTNSYKWNEFPNIKVRARRMCDEQLSPDDISVTGHWTTLNAVKDKAYFHYMTNCFKAGASTASSATMMVGISVSSNPNTNATTPVNHYFAASHLLFNFPNTWCGPWWAPCGPSAINEVFDSQNNFDAYPVPTLKELTIEFPNPQNNSFQYSITDLAGKIIRIGELEGDQKTSLNVQELTAGVYILSIRDGDKLVGVKKFVKQ